MYYDDEDDEEYGDYGYDDYYDQEDENYYDEEDDYAPNTQEFTVPYKQELLIDVSISEKKFNNAFDALPADDLALVEEAKEPAEA